MDKPPRRPATRSLPYEPFSLTKSASANRILRPSILFLRDPIVADRKAIAEEIVFVAQGRGVDFADVRVVEETSTRAMVQDGRGDKMSRQSELGAGIRVLVNGAWGFVSADTFSRRTLLTALDEAIELARDSAARVTDPAVMATIKPAVADYYAPFGIDPRNVPARDKIAAIKRYEAAARKHGGAMVVNSIVTYSDAVVAETIANTRGVLVDHETMRVVIGCQMAVHSDGITQLGVEHRGIVGGWEIIDFSLRAVDKAMALLSAKPAPAGSFPIIFHPSITGLLAHEALGHNAEADGVWSGQSILEGKLGQRHVAGQHEIADTIRVGQAHTVYRVTTSATKPAASSRLRKRCGCSRKTSSSISVRVRTPSQRFTTVRRPSPRGMSLGLKWGDVRVRSSEGSNIPFQVECRKESFFAPEQPSSTSTFQLTVESVGRTVMRICTESPSTTWTARSMGK